MTDSEKPQKMFTDHFIQHVISKSDDEADGRLKILEIQVQTLVEILRLVTPFALDDENDLRAIVEGKVRRVKPDLGTLYNENTDFEAIGKNIRYTVWNAVLEHVKGENDQQA